MPLLRCDVGSDGLRFHKDGGLEACLTQTPASAPVVVMVHGFKFAPGTPQADPHQHIFSLTPPPACRKAVSWPLALGFDSGALQEGLCIAFGWPARGSIWNAWQAAEKAGQALADLTRRVAAAGRRVDIIAHSLGARVCLEAMRLSPAASIGRVILLNAAEFRSTAEAAAQSPAGQMAEICNIVSRENDLYEALIEALVRAPTPGERTLGTGLSLPNWLDVQIDAKATRDALTRLGVDMKAAPHLFCHWSPYLHPGLMGFYARLLRERDRLSLPLLRARLPKENQPRWARLRLPLPAYARQMLGLRPTASAQPPSL